MDNQLLLSMHELRFATIACSHCNTRVTVDFTAEVPPPRSPFACPQECPRCGNRFDSAVPKAVESMQKAFQALKDVEEAAVTFTIHRT